MIALRTANFAMVAIVFAVQTTSSMRSCDCGRFDPAWIAIHKLSNRKLVWAGVRNLGAITKDAIANVQVALKITASAMRYCNC